jgi:hypothetical protein
MSIQPTIELPDSLSPTPNVGEICRRMSQNNPGEDWRWRLHPDKRSMHSREARTITNDDWQRGHHISNCFSQSVHTIDHVEDFKKTKDSMMRNTLRTFALYDVVGLIN